MFISRINQLVETHEYLAPEIIKVGGEGHGSTANRWTFGILLHELLYGKTPFKSSGNRATLINVVRQQLRFLNSPATVYASSDFNPGLAGEEAATPARGEAVKRGATEIKQRPFFAGVNWALIRRVTPPEVPRRTETKLPGMPGKFEPVEPVGVGSSGKRMVGTDMKSGGKYLDFEFF